MKGGTRIWNRWAGLAYEKGGGGLVYERGMLVVSLKGVNIRYWTYLGCSRLNAMIFSHVGLV